MKSLLFFLKKLTTNKRELFFGIALSLTLSFSSIALLTLSGWFISAAAFSGLTLISAALFNYFIPASLIRLLAFIRILSRYADRVINHDITFKILSSLRVWFYQKLLPLSPAYLFTHRSGDLLNRIVHDIDTLDQLYLNVLSPFFIALFLLGAITIFTAYFTVHLAFIIFILFSAALTIIPIITYKNAIKMGEKIQTATAELRTKTIDFLQGFVDLLLFTKKNERLSIIDLQHSELTRAQKKFASIKGFTISAMQLCSGVTVWLMLIFGIPLVQQHIMNGAELAMFVLLLIAAFEQLTQLPFAFLSLGKSKAAADRLLEIADTSPTIRFLHDKKPANYDIVFDSVSFSYPNSVQNTIHQFSLSIPEGMHFMLTGDSGSGKTTLAHLLTRIWDVHSGKITIGEIHIQDFSEKTLRETISLVTQHVHIFNVSVRDNLTLMNNDYSDDALFSVLKKVELDTHIRNLPDQLDTLMGEFGKNFSGGQIRRIAIARALLANTPIIILDEPSTGLGKAFMQTIWKNCENDFKNKTVIVISHEEVGVGVGVKRYPCEISV